MNPSGPCVHIMHQSIETPIPRSHGPRGGGFNNWNVGKPERRLNSMCDYKKQEQQRPGHNKKDQG